MIGSLGRVSASRLWLGSVLQSLAPARPEYGSDRTFGRVSTAVSHRADLRWSGLARLVVTQRRHGSEGTHSRIGGRCLRPIGGVEPVYSGDRRTPPHAAACRSTTVLVDIMARRPAGCAPTRPDPDQRRLILS
jgi:hypothetical protein